MAVTIVRTPWIDDDGSGTTGTVLNNAIKTELYNQIDGALAGTAAATAVIFSSATGTQHNWAPGIAGAYTLILWDGAGDLVVTGLAGGVQGQIVTFKQNAVTATRLVSFAHFSASSADNNKLINIATSAATMLGTYGVISYQYDGSYWRLIAHEQGGWITPPFNASNFTGTSGAWTVEAGDVVTLKYRLSGRTLTVLFNFQNTVNSAVGILTFTYPGGYSAADSPQPHQWTRANTQTGMSQPQGTQLWLWADPAGSGFLAGAIASIQGTAIVEVV